MKTENGLVSRYDIRNVRSGEPMTEALHFVYLELGRLNASVDEPHKCKTLLEQFAYSTKYMHELPQRPDGYDNPLLVELYDAAEFANWSPGKQREYDIIMRTELDIIAEKEYIREEEREKSAQKEAEAIRALKAQGVSDQVIALSFGKTIEEIQAL